MRKLCVVAALAAEVGLAEKGRLVEWPLIEAPYGINPTQFERRRNAFFRPDVWQNEQSGS